MTALAPLKPPQRSIDALIIGRISLCAREVGLTGTDIVAKPRHP